MSIIRVVEALLHPLKLEEGPSNRIQKPYESNTFSCSIYSEASAPSIEFSHSMTILNPLLSSRK